MNQGNKEPSFFFSFFLLTLSCLIILISSLIYRMKVQPLFFLALSVSLFICRIGGYSFEDMMGGITEYCKKAVGPSLILLCAGAMIGVWNACGTIPMFTLAGLSVIRSSVFLPIAFGISLAFAFVTGTVFGACGTIGVVFMAIGKAAGVDPIWCVSAVSSGAFLGYGISPLADCTNIAASLVKMDLGESIRYQLMMIIPSILLLGVFYGWMNIHVIAPIETKEIFQDFVKDIQSVCRIGAATVIPIFAVLFLLLKRWPTILSLMLGTLCGIPICIFYQHMSIQDTMMVLWKGPDFTACNGIFSRGGMTGMTDTTILFLLAFSLFGLFQSCGIIHAVIQPLMQWADTPGKGTTASVLLGMAANLLSASAICSFIFTLSCMEPVYEEKGWKKSDLIRSAFVGCLYFSLWIPWHSNVVTSSALLGVDIWQMQSKACVPLTAGMFFLLSQKVLRLKKERER